jgi:hypothetical protein
MIYFKWQNVQFINTFIITFKPGLLFQLFPFKSIPIRYMWNTCVMTNTVAVYFKQAYYPLFRHLCSCNLRISNCGNDIVTMEQQRWINPTLPQGRVRLFNLLSNPPRPSALSSGSSKEIELRTLQPSCDFRRHRIYVAYPHIMQSPKAEDISTSFIDCVIYPERHFSHIKMQPTSAQGSLIIQGLVP